jgi:hypothetical protein
MSVVTELEDRYLRKWAGTNNCDKATDGEIQLQLWWYSYRQSGKRGIVKVAIDGRPTSSRFSDGSWSGVCQGSEDHSRENKMVRLLQLQQPRNQPILCPGAGSPQSPCDLSPGASIFITHHVSENSNGPRSHKLPQQIFYRVAFTAGDAMTANSTGVSLQQCNGPAQSHGREESVRPMSARQRSREAAEWKRARQLHPAISISNIDCERPIASIVRRASVRTPAL